MNAKFVQNARIEHARALSGPNRHKVVPEAHPMRSLCLVLLAVGAAVLIGACGGSSDHTSDAAKCLRNALANQKLDPSNTSCGDSTAANIEDGGSGTKITVACTHQGANEYICDVKVPDGGGINLSGIQGGFYNVTYDGKSIVFQPS